MPPVALTLECVVAAVVWRLEYLFDSTWEVAFCRRRLAFSLALTLAAFAWLVLSWAAFAFRAAVWLAYAGRSVTDKMVAVILPVSAFVAAGFEHCVANMYFLPLAWLLVQTGHAPANVDVSLITISGIIHNLVPVTLGNIVGGAGFVGAVYWTIYRVTFGVKFPDQ